MYLNMPACNVFQHNVFEHAKMFEHTSEMVNDRIYTHLSLAHHIERENHVLEF